MSESPAALPVRQRHQVKKYFSDLQENEIKYRVCYGTTRINAKVKLTTNEIIHSPITPSQSSLCS